MLATAISGASGRWLGVPNEAEAYWREGETWGSYPGAVTVIDLNVGLKHGLLSVLSVGRTCSGVSA